MKKKTLSLLLALTLVFSAFGGVLAAGRNITPTFSDVPANHWAFSYIEELVTRRAINGYPDGNFYPEETVSREAFAKIMVVAARLTPVAAETATYADVPSDHWAFSYIETARPYMTAYQNQGQLFFYPAAGALREDIAVAVVKLKGYDVRMADVSILATMFSDLSSISEVARPYVATAVEKGLMTGYDDHTFRGQGTITRSEAAAILWRAFQQGAGDKVIPDDILPSPTPTPMPVVSPTSTPLPGPAPTPEPTATPEPTLEETPCPTEGPSVTDYLYLKRVGTSNKNYTNVTVILADGGETTIKIAAGEPTAKGIYLFTINSDGYYELHLASKQADAKDFYRAGTVWSVSADTVVIGTTETDRSEYFTTRNTVEVDATEEGGVVEKGAVVEIVFDKESEEILMMVVTESAPDYTTRTVYGIVTGYNGIHKIGVDTYTQYTIAVGVGEVIQANIASTVKDAVIRKGDIVIFEEAIDNICGRGDFQILQVRADGTVFGGGEGWAVGAVKEYSNGILSYGTQTTYNVAQQVYEMDRNVVETKSVSRDAVLAYLDLSDIAYGEEIGIVGFNVISGKENILFHTNDEGVIDVLFVETGDKGFGATTKFPAG